MASTTDNSVLPESLRSLGNALTRSCPGRGITCPEESYNPVQDVAADSLANRLRGRLFQRFGLLRSIAIRMGLTFWLMFTLCFGGGSYMVYAAVQDRILAKMDEGMIARFAELRDVHMTLGPEALERIADSRNEQPMLSSTGFLLRNPAGEKLAGNVSVFAAGTGWEMISGQQLGLDDAHGQYRFFTGTVGENLLSIGRGMGDLDEFREIMLACLLWAFLIATVLAFMIGAYFARSTHRRVARISQSLDIVGKGNLGARLPVSCLGDDVDRLSEKINGSLERLEHTVNGMRQVSTDIAHDLKTPLNRLFISLDEAAERSRAGICVGDDLDQALEETRAINSTFEALLRIAQIEAGARRSQFRHFNLNQVLETAGEVYAPVVDEQCGELIVDLPTDEPLPMFGDQQLTLQLVVNLIENAVHHCDGDTRITLSAGQEDGVVWFSVGDNGPGIPKAEREKVFQRLYRLERSRTTRGTGLGLSLVKAIADLHCGTVSLDDNDPGLAVTVRFNRDCPED